MMNSFKPKKTPGPKEPNDIKTPLPRIDKKQIRVRDTLDAEEEDDLTPLGTLMGGTLRALRAEAQRENKNSSSSTATDLDAFEFDDLEQKLKTMDFFTSADGSTEDLVGARKAVVAETYNDVLSNNNNNMQSGSPEDLLARIDELVDQERFDYMELPKTDAFGTNLTMSGSGASEDLGATSQIPHNQLAHGDW